MNSISGATTLLGIIGWPVAHSFSPAMHNAAVGSLDLDAVYVPLPVAPETLPAALAGLGALGFLGVNVTVPHKQAVMPFLDEIEPAARAIGAVNTIRVARGEPQREGDAARSSLSGFNTDWAGFLRDLRQKEVELEGRECLVLGAGGSARAVVYALAQAGARVHVFARRPQQARQLIADLNGHLKAPSLHAHSWDRLDEAPASFAAPLIVNSTPVGMHPDEARCPWPEQVPFPQGAVVYDLIYNPAQTRLMRQAADSGCLTYNGSGMLLYQAALAFELWLGVLPSLEVMAAAMG